MTDRTLCLGEALVDVVLREGTEPAEHVGGSLFNVACGLASLGHATSILSWWGRDERGTRISDAARAAGVEIVPGSDGAPRTPLAHAHLDADGRATYEFDLTWQVPPLDDPARYRHLHTGSFAATLAPGADGVVAASQMLREHASISYDPNIRPALMGAPSDVTDRVSEMIALADVVKASDEDVEWLYPGRTPARVMRDWAAGGPALVVITRGPEGADALLAGQEEPLHLDPPPVTVADTVGAGDSFMAGLLSGLMDGGYLGSRDAVHRLRTARAEDLRPALVRAMTTSALTVGRAGAHAPSMDEVRSATTGIPGD
ncbi:carbohydrate kinase [Tsukamurella serpentis]